MPIFCDIRFTCGGGRCGDVLAVQERSIETAASWPCATAQMMFFGPKAASPPKNTLRQRRLQRLSSSTGRPHLSNSMPQSRSIQGKAFSWPTATSTSSQGEELVGLAGGHQAAPALVVVLASTFSKVMPVSLPPRAGRPWARGS
jgi:hypothetical protein